MAFDSATALALLMGRMDRAGVATPAPLTDYWTKALEAAVAELTKKGITLQDTADDSMLVANLATEILSSRDKSGARPLWLALAIRERWLQERGTGQDAD